MPFTAGAALASVAGARAAALDLALHLLFGLRLALGLFFLGGRLGLELLARQPRPIDEVLLLVLVHVARDRVDEVEPPPQLVLERTDIGRRHPSRQPRLRGE